MKISCTQENLNQGLFVVSHLASKNSALPILNNILIKAQENSIKLSATNLEIGVTCEIRGKVEMEGDFTVQSKLLADYVNLLPKERIDLLVTDQDGQNPLLNIECKNYSTKINGQGATEFPLIPQISRVHSYSVDSQALRQAISQVIFAVSISETRPEINGVMFSLSPSELILAATDGYRLAEKTIKLDGKSKGGDQQVIVPTRTLQELQRILGSFKDPAAISDLKNIDIYLAENQVLFSFGGIELISRLVEGQYPDYRQIIPQQSTTKIVLSTADLISAAKTASLFARSGIYDINLSFSSTKKEATVGAINNQLGENESTLSADISGSDNDIVVNYRYLLDALQNINSDQVEIKLIDSGSPCALRPAGASSDYIYIIMPIRR
ncbi:MAG: DNA polymerase III subunit beta [Patescibacteria group bacterium]|nr:DNA polymerase III subunit beta [Patescibacteria group bacterium]